MSQVRNAKQVGGGRRRLPTQIALGLSSRAFINLWHKVGGKPCSMENIVKYAIETASTHS